MFALKQTNKYTSFLKKLKIYDMIIVFVIKN